MIRLLFPILLLTLVEITSTQAQDSEKEERFYRAYDGPGRLRDTRPPFGYQELQKMLANGEKLSQAAFDSLSAEERFTFSIAFPENYAQICSNRPVQSLEGKIYFKLPVVLLGFSRSHRQWDFLRNNPALTTRLIKQSIQDSVFIGYNYKTTILALNAIELIPALISNYSTGKDHDVLTLLMNLMDRNQYQPFFSSSIAKEYSREVNSLLSDEYMPFNTGNEQLILGLARGLYEKQGSAYKLIPAGVYEVGKEGHSVNPLRKVKVDSFRIAVHETTNDAFARFVEATGYITDAERNKDALVFEPGLEEFRWKSDSSAFWRFPNGTGRGGIEDKMNHPVTCISYSDILAYCKWAELRLPSLDEWEIACRAGSDKDYFFGNDNKDIGRYANIWHRRDHLQADNSDGFMYTSPVGSFLPNAWGLYDMYGNVFEFCSGKTAYNNKEHLAHARGGSWWCSKFACNFFNSVDIGRTHIHASFSNQGFRVVRP